jgi:GH24 family phage-related lysozyme (muramidase)
MSEWTTGDWETDDNMGVWATGGGMVGQFFHVSMGITLEQAEANARLVAAAPTMAEALDPDTLDVAADKCQGAGLAAVATALRMVAERQRAALKLAKGEDRNG